MIVIEQDNDLLQVHIYSDLSLEDFREFEHAVTDELTQYDHVNILFDLTSMTGFSLDVVLEELRFNKSHATDYEKLAVVTDSQWLTWVSWLATAFVSAEVQQFDDVDTAMIWLREETGTAPAA